MPSKTGIWNAEEALEHHDFSYFIARFLGNYLNKEDVLIDFGCGKGTYLRYFHDLGFEQLHGVEGENLPFSEFGNISVQDLTQRIVKDPTGNSLCLEVGEHIPKEYESILIDNLVYNTKKKLILSWAIPGQDGYGHVNCKHNIDVVREFERRGLSLNVKDSLEIRQHVEDRLHYFRNTLLIFEK